MAKRKWHHHIKHLVVPHEGNNFRPKIVGVTAICAVLFVAVLVEGAYLLTTKVSFDNNNLLASIVPSALIALTNADRAEVGIAELKENATLAAAAQLKADDMAAKGYFAHVTPDGKQPWHWLDQAGYSYTYAGENLAVNFDDSRDVEEAWVNSPTHYANIVKRQYTEIGIATARGTYKGEEVTFVVQFFASPKVAVAAAAPTPVAPVERPVVASAPTPEVTVLGEETVEPVVEPAGPVEQIKDSAVQAVASPAHTATLALLILALIVAVMFLIALAAHIKVPYLEALGGTFAVLVIVAGLLTFNATNAPHIEVPKDATAAAVLAL